MRKSKLKSEAATKASKIQLRLRPTQKALLDRAAALQQSSLSSFVLEHACAAAQQLLAEQTEIVLSPAQWEAFSLALDAPPHPIPALQKLFSEASVFDDRASSAAS